MFCKNMNPSKCKQSEEYPVLSEPGQFAEIVHEVSHLSTEIGLCLKIQLVKFLVWSLALYGSGSWAVKKTEEKKLDALET